MAQGRRKSVERAARQEPGLGRAQIVSAAMRLLDESGFDELTMRNLAKSLGVKAASLYWHVRSKQELLGMLAEEIVAPMPLPDPALPWDVQLTQMALEYRRLLLAHRDASRVLSEAGAPTGPNQLRLSDAVLRSLLSAGFSDRQAAYIGLMLVQFVNIFGESGGTEQSPRGGEGTLDETGEAAQPGDFSSYPSLMRLAPYLADAGSDEAFRFGIDLLLDGLRDRLAKDI